MRSHAYYKLTLVPQLFVVVSFVFAFLSTFAIDDENRVTAILISWSSLEIPLRLSALFISLLLVFIPIVFGAIRLKVSQLRSPWFLMFNMYAILSVSWSQFPFKTIFSGLQSFAFLLTIFAATAIDSSRFSSKGCEESERFEVLKSLWNVFITFCIVLQFAAGVSLMIYGTMYIQLYNPETVRLFSLFPYITPVQLGYLSMVTVIDLSARISSRKRRGDTSGARLIFVLLLSYCLGCLFWTGTRSVLIGILLLIMVSTIHRLLLLKANRFMFALLASAVLVFIISALVGSVPFEFNRGSSGFWSGRFENWIDAIRMMGGANPARIIFGHGYASGMNVTDISNLRISLHSFVLNMVFEVGIAGSIFYATFLVESLTRIVKFLMSRTIQQGDRTLLASISLVSMASLPMMAVESFTLYYPYCVVQYFLASILLIPKK